jgi:hypothetical protein
MVIVRFSYRGERHELDKSESAWHVAPVQASLPDFAGCFDLPDLSDEILRDIGLSRGSEQFKPAMPFWVP